jgi:hypothetical protein
MRRGIKMSQAPCVCAATGGRFAYLLIDADYGIRGLLFADQVFVDL